MRGPDMDNILDDLDIASILKDDRIEVMSTVSESELSELHDRGSVRGVFVDKQAGVKARQGKGGAGRGRKTMNI